MDKITVAICAYNPDKNIFNRVIQSLKDQSLTQDEWELLIIDNNSDEKISLWLDLGWHQNSTIVVEDNPGLIHARIRATKDAKHALIVSVDDDTPIDQNYLRHVQRIYHENPDLGIIGGKTIPIFEKTPPSWLPEFYNCLAIRDLGEEQIIQKITPETGLTVYPFCSPLLIAPKKECMEAYIDYFNANKESKTLGRKGKSLASGEDNDINLFIFKKGYALGYFPELKFYHIIPAKRMTVEYLAKLQHDMNKSWIKVLSMYQINPWQPISSVSVPFRKIKAWFTNKTWKSPVNYIRWKGVCGTFDGLSELTM